MATALTDADELTDAGALTLLDYAAPAEAPDPVPMLVLTGFLGAGKTTMLNRILEGEHGLRVAVLVNDFGDMNIDADLVTGVRAGVVTLANGCVCCTIRDDLIETVLAAIDLPERPEYIVLEASGVAEPSGIATTFSIPELRGRIRLDSVTCVLDAEQVLEVPELMELKIWQAAFADLLVLNKVDLVDRAQVGRVTAWLDSRMHRYRLIETAWCDVPVELLMSAGRFGAQALAALPGPGPVGAAATQALETWSFETDEPLDLASLRDVAAHLPAGVYRAKGIVRVTEIADRPVILHVVGRRVDLSAGLPWGDSERRTRIVAIGASGALADGLSGMLSGCVAVPGSVRGAL